MITYGRVTHNILHRIGKLESEIEDLKYDNSMIQFKVRDNIIEDSKIKNLYLMKGSIY